MTVSVYGLYDPRQPTLMVYVGRTSVRPFKRTRDHIAAARHRERHGLKLPPVLRWINQLLAEGVEPRHVVLFEYASDEAAMQCEALFIESFPTLLNDKRPVYLFSGRKAGTVDTAESRARKKQAATAAVSKLRNATRRITRTPRMEEQGYPHPHLPTTHFLNADHHRVVQGLNPCTRSAEQREHMRVVSLENSRQRFKEWRTFIGMPNPNEGIYHPDNIAWVEINLKTAVRFKEWNRTK